jgi:hypothetical protein
MSVFPSDEKQNACLRSSGVTDKAVSAVSGCLLKPLKQLRAPAAMRLILRWSGLLVRPGKRRVLESMK